MKITNITVRNKNGHPRLKGVASVALDQGLALNNIKIIQTSHGMCVDFPVDQDGKALVAPLNQNTRTYMQELILKAYRLNADYFLTDTPA